MAYPQGDYTDTLCAIPDGVYEKSHDAMSQTRGIEALMSKSRQGDWPIASQIKALYSRDIGI